MGMEGVTGLAARDTGKLIRAERSPSFSAVAGIVMAAGSSRRFGGVKLLEPFHGKPLVRWVIEAALESRLASVNVILGHEHDRILQALADIDGAGRLSFTLNEQHESGQSASIIAGLSAIPADSVAAMFLVADQPLLDASAIDRLIDVFEGSPASICYPWCEGQRRNPVIFARCFFPELRQLSGDVGGGAVIARHREAAVAVTFDNSRQFRDIDRRSDMHLLSTEIRTAPAQTASAALIHALGLDTSRVISLCGSGGKTGLMKALVREFAAREAERVLATTTTKLGVDELDGPWRSCQAVDAASLLAATEDEVPAVLAYRGVDAQRGRLLGLPAETLDELAKSGRFTRILVEADGSRRRPLKAPDGHEPVFPASTDVVVMVAGLSGLGLPLNDGTVFRPDRWSALTGCQPSERVTADALARVIVHPDGLARGAPAEARRVLFLNQADTPERLTQANRVRDVLSTLDRCPERVAIGQLRPEVHVYDIHAFAASK